MGTMLRSKVTLLVIVSGLLLAVAGVAFADIVVADGDTVAGGVQGSKDLGTVQPGATVNPTINFLLRCETQGQNRHFNSDDTANINFAGATIRDANNNTPATGSATATSTPNLSGPNTNVWPADGTPCPSGQADRSLASSTVTIVAPKKAGTYTVTVDYTVNQGANTTTQELGNNITNDPLTFTLNVPNVAPSITSFSGVTSATEGETKTYTVSATDANDDSLTYNLVKSSTGGADVTITPTKNAQNVVVPGSFDVKFLTSGSVDLRASASDGTATTTQNKTVTVASAVTATNVSNITASPSAFGGTTDLSAKVSPSGAPGSVAFFVNGSSTAASGTVTYDSTTGVATLSNYSHGLDASATPYSVKAVFTPSGSSFSGSNATNASALTVNKATSNVAVTCPTSPVTYTGSALTPCSAKVTGAGGLDQALTVSYTDNTNAGTAHASASFGGDANHTGNTGSATFEIGKAASSVQVDCPTSPVTYTGSALEPCTAHATGAGGLNEALTVSYTDNTNVGTAHASASYAGDANHTGSSGQATFEITKAASTTTVTCPVSKIYTGSALTPCTVSVTGAGGLNLTPNATYSNNTNVGTATASYNYAGDANHTGSQDSKTFAILYSFSGYLQPVNDTAHQIGTLESKFKLGQTIPLKFNIYNAGGSVVQQLTNPTFTKVSHGTCDTQTAVEDAPTVTPDPGTQFVWTTDHYQYNWSTKGLAAGEWRVYANLADGTGYQPGQAGQNYTDICLTK